jgi:hypothetical protein
MKRFVHSTVLFAVFFFGLIPRIWAQEDSGDHWTEATPLALNSSYSESIGEISHGTRDGRDWFALSLTSYGLVQFTLSAPDFTAAIAVYGAQTHNNSITAGSAVNGSDTVSAFLRPGTYDINVRSPTPNQGIYTLTVTQVPEVQPTFNNEADDTWEQATPIAMDNTIVGNIGYYDSAKEIDRHNWYLVNVAEYGLVHFQITGQGIKIQMSVFGDKSKYPGYNYIQSVSATHHEEPNNSAVISLYLMPGVYYIDVAKYFKIPNIGIYTLTVTQDPETQPNFLNEEDDTFEGANTIELDNPNNGNIGYYADDKSIDYHDWYRIVISRYGEVHFELQAPFLFATLSIYGDKDQYPSLPRLAKKDALDYTLGSNSAVISRHLMPGTYFIDINRYGSQPNTRPYMLAVTQDPEAQPTFISEVDDNYTETLRIQPNTIYTGNIGYYNSVYDIDFDDWYALRLPFVAGVIITVRVTGFNTIFRVYGDPPNHPIHSFTIQDETVTFLLAEDAPTDLTFQVTRIGPPEPREGAYSFFVSLPGSFNSFLQSILLLLLSS